MTQQYKVKTFFNSNLTTLETELNLFFSENNIDIIKFEHNYINDSLKIFILYKDIFKSGFPD